MPELNDLPKGFSVPIPNKPPAGAKKMSLAEIEKEILKTIAEKELEVRQAIYNLVILYEKTGLLEKATFHLERLMQMTDDVGEKAHYYFSLGQLMEQAGDYEKAVVFYQKAFTLEPTNKKDWYFIHNNLGFSLNTLGRFSEGERYCKIAIQIDPHRYNAYKNLAISQEGQGQYVDAAMNFIEATKKNAADPRALRHLEDLLKKQPQLLRDNPSLLSELENCQKASKWANEFVQVILDKYWK